MISIQFGAVSRITEKQVLHSDYLIEIIKKKNNKMGKIHLFTVVFAVLCVSVYCNETTDFLKGTSKDYISPVS